MPWPEMLKTRFCTKPLMNDDLMYVSEQEEGRDIDRRETVVSAVVAAIQALHQTLDLSDDANERCHTAALISDLAAQFMYFHRRV